MTSQADNAASKKGGNQKGGEEVEVDLDHLGELLKKEIEDIFRVLGGDVVVLEAKPTIDIL